MERAQPGVAWPSARALQPHIFPDDGDNVDRGLQLFDEFHYAGRAILSPPRARSRLSPTRRVRARRSSPPQLWRTYPPSTVGSGTRVARAVVLSQIAFPGAQIGLPAPLFRNRPAPPFVRAVFRNALKNSGL